MLYEWHRHPQITLYRYEMTGKFLQQLHFINLLVNSH